MIAQVVILPEMFAKDYLMPHGKRPDESRVETVLTALRWVGKHGVLMDLRAGAWQTAVNLALRPQRKFWHGSAITAEIERLDKQGRIIQFDSLGEADWLSEAMQWHDRLCGPSYKQGLAAILAPESLVPTALEDSPACTDLRSISITQRPHWYPAKSERGYARQILGPLLRHARNITVVDRYLTPDDEETRCFFYELMQILDDRPGQFNATHVMIYVGDPAQIMDRKRSQTVETAIDTWRTYLESLAEEQPGLSFTVRFWKYRPWVSNWERMHDRWLTTDFDAILAPAGFGITPPGKGTRRSVWGLLDWEATNWLEDSFSPIGGTSGTGLILEREFSTGSSMGQRRKLSVAPRENPVSI